MILISVPLGYAHYCRAPLYHSFRLSRIFYRPGRSRVYHHDAGAVVEASRQTVGLVLTDLILMCIDKAYKRLFIAFKIFSVFFAATQY